MNMKFLLLIMVVFATDENENDVESGTGSREQAGKQSIVVKIEEDEYVKKKTSNHVGVIYDEQRAKWRVQRRSKDNKKLIYNGSYKDEETAAHASDTAARKLIANGEKGHRLNFPDDETEVYPEKASNHIGVYYHKRDSTWSVQRQSKDANKVVYNGHYKDKETAAHASDTLARKLIANGEKGHELNFPDDDTEVHPEKSFNYIGVSYIKTRATWRVQRYSKHENKALYHYNGSYKDKETAARASDTLARKLIANGEKGHKLNFPEDDIEVYPEKASNYIGVTYNKKHATWDAQRWSKNESKTFYNGTYKNEETAVRASDTLARKLIANGEKGHKLNFPDVNAKEVMYQKKKRKRPNHLENSQDNESY